MPHYNYCVNVLIIGCSFSYGSYYMDDSIANARDAEQCTGDVCWYDWLDPQHHYTVYTIPGGGWLNYMTILSEINLKQFDQLKLLVENTAKKYDFEFIDGAVLFSNHEDPLIYFNYRLPTHFNIKGYRALAKFISDELN